MVPEAVKINEMIKCLGIETVLNMCWHLKWNRITNIGKGNLISRAEKKRTLSSF